MSEPALKTQTTAAARQPSGPLQDWLATLSRIDAADQARAAPRRPAEAPPAWEPRIVAPGGATPAPAPEAAPPPAAGAEPDDLAALMAENMMLKARLRQEHGRYDELQALLAEELRSLRAHVQHEVDKAEELRVERDLWMARAEALAQPLFQPRR
ncbi:hypothetical protein DA075_29880 [Methylobacterium currus]|uniref:Uncharacterized protein n=1 Tax=Methylobacterium currus TaxID=2051553 RepID=A0A2R4WSL2_9HYPH|nr:hypothetical protein [Methylobacterium currus]AWB24541.1 hypothetical protein DA075_29880 [Methylobacterium currus]UHC16330.1 hypothetical protein LRS73_28430 [Methylobacterium currus]